VGLRILVLDNKQAEHFVQEADFDAENCVKCGTYYIHTRRDNQRKCNGCFGLQDE
jgi:hypothetical protein